MTENVCFYEKREVQNKCQTANTSHITDDTTYQLIFPEAKRTTDVIIYGCY